MRRISACLIPASSLKFRFVEWLSCELWRHRRYCERQFWLYSTLSFLSLRFLFTLIFLFLFFIYIPRFSYFHFLCAFPSTCLFWFFPTPTFSLLFFLSLSFLPCCLDFRPFALTSILLSFYVISIFIPSLPRSCFYFSILLLFLLYLILNPHFFLKLLRWSTGSVLAFGTQVRGFKPGRSSRIFQGQKILSTPSFGREVKPFVPCRM